MHDQHRAAWQVLSRILGASGSGRLFHEVRQKRSLCYAVGGGWDAIRRFWQIHGFAGTTPDRAETVQVVEEVMHGILNAARLKKKSLGPKKGPFGPYVASKARRPVPVCSAIISPPSERCGIQKEVQSIVDVDCRNGGGVVGVDLGDPLGRCIGGNKPIF